VLDVYIYIYIYRSIESIEEYTIHNCGVEIFSNDTAKKFEINVVVRMVLNFELRFQELYRLRWVYPAPDRSD
jgi:hypothetical protein